MRLRQLFIMISGLLLLFFAFPAVGEGTRTWEQSRFDDLIKGTGKGVAIRSAGGLELAPAFKSIATTPSTYIWSIAADQAGNLYAATGAPARVYRITPDGQSTPIFEPQELQVQAWWWTATASFMPLPTRMARSIASNIFQFRRQVQPRRAKRQRAKSDRRVNSPRRFILIPRRNTSGISPWMETTICTLPPGIGGKSSA